MAVDAERLARELYEAQRTARPVELLTARIPELSWADARRIATASDALRRRLGDELIGYKLGFTSAAMREALGVERPNWGTLWASQLSDGAIDLDALIHPKLEPELVFRAASDLEDEMAPADVAASGAWALGLEIVDPRWPTFEFDLLDNTADNSSSARVVVGEFREIESPADVAVELDDGQAVRSGAGASAMGDPAAAVVWLVRSLAAEGSVVRAGDIVFTGGLTMPIDVVPGTTYRLRADELGEVRATA